MNMLAYGPNLPQRPSLSWLSIPLSRVLAVRYTPLDCREKFHVFSFLRMTCMSPDYAAKVQLWLLNVGSSSKSSQDPRRKLVEDGIISRLYAAN